MKTIAVFDLENYSPEMPVFKRSAVRAIIVRENKILLVKSEKEGFYKFPGGGMEKGEDFSDTLIRETREETGYSIIPSSVKEFGLIKEKRRSTIDENQIFEQLSYYFTAAVDDSLTVQSLDAYEEELGFVPEWVDISVAYSLNKLIAEQNKNTFIERETFVLKMLEENSYEI